MPRYSSLHFNVDECSEWDSNTTGIPCGLLCFVATEVALKPPSRKAMTSESLGRKSQVNATLNPPSRRATTRDSLGRQSQEQECEP